MKEILELNITDPLVKIDYGAVIEKALAEDVYVVVDSNEQYNSLYQTALRLNGTMKSKGQYHCYRSTLNDGRLLVYISDKEQDRPFEGVENTVGRHSHAYEKRIKELEDSGEVVVDTYAKASNTIDAYCKYKGIDRKGVFKIEEIASGQFRIFKK